LLLLLLIVIGPRGAHFGCRDCELGSSPLDCPRRCPAAFAESRIVSGCNQSHRIRGVFRRVRHERAARCQRGSTGRYVDCACNDHLNENRGFAREL
jgi:hypothetical protein